jgi:hypothetical protein
MEIEMTSRVFSGHKTWDDFDAAVVSLSWALAVRVDLAPQPIAAAVAAVRNVLRFTGMMDALSCWRSFDV